MTNKKHNKDWETFKDSLELSKEELAEIESSLYIIYLKGAYYKKV